MSGKYLIDTSVWVDYFRDKDKELNDFIDQLIGEDRVYINGIIRSELLIGTKTQREYDSVKECLDFTLYSSPPETDQITTEIMS